MAGTSYTRQSTLTDGDTITASLFNAEYNQLVTAFSYAASGTTGHQHDGGAGEGGNIEIIGDQDFNNKIVVDSSNNRWSVYVEVGGSAVEQVRIEDGVVYPVTDSDVDLGTNALRFKDAYIDSLTATGNLTIGGNIDVDGTIEFDGLSGTGSVTVTDILDQDDMSGNSATALATQQSIKAYVDSQVTAQDLDLTDGTTSISIDLDSEALSVLGGTGVTSTASGNGVTLAIDSTVATLTGSQTLTNKTLTSPDVNTPDIDGGTIDGTVIGGSSAAAGSFTTVGATGNITVGGTVDGRDVATDGTKLDTIETSATADQTDAEIRTAVEAASDSNVFTDADHSKLNAIEASADVTDTANVTSAGALMDSELTSIASVKALNQGVATTDSPTFAAVTVNGNVEFDGLSGTGSVTVTDILDQDDMSGNSATALATQQSIKAYVDTQITAEDLDITTDSGTIAIDLDSETLTVSGGTGLDSSATGNAVTLAIDSTVATLTGSQTLTNKSLTAPTLTGTATVASLDISGDIDVDGTTNLDVVDIDGAVDMASTLKVGTRLGIGVAAHASAALNITTSGTDQSIRFNNGSELGIIELNSDGNLNVWAHGDSETLNLKTGTGSGNNILSISGSASSFAGTVAITTADNNPQLTLISTDADANVGPILKLYRNSPSPADNDAVGRLLFTGEDDAGNEATYARIETIATDVSNGSENAKMEFYVAINDTFNPSLTLEDTGAATFTGAITANAGVVVDNITIDGNEIDVGSGDLTLDVVGTITLDADNTGTIYLKDGGTTYGQFFQSSNSFYIQSTASDADMIFRGNDAGNVFTALTLDMSAAGNATFNGTVLASNGTASLPSLSFSGDSNTGIYRSGSDNLGFATGGQARAFMSGTQFNMTGNGIFSGNGTFGGTLGVTGAATFGEAITANAGVVVDNITIDGNEIDVGSGDLTLDVAGDISLDADGGEVFFKDGGTSTGKIRMNDGDLQIRSLISDKDITLEGNDNGTIFEAMRLDMSAAGAATFNSSVTAIDLNLTSASPVIRFIETDQSNKNYILGSFGSAFAIYDNTASQYRYIIDTNGNHIFNEGGADVDFRVESSGNANMLFVDGGDNRVGVGTSSPSRQFTVENTLANSGGVVGLTSSDSSTSGSFGIIHFGNSTDSSLASINAIADGSTTSGALLFKTEATGGSIEERFRISSDGSLSTPTAGTSNVRFGVNAGNSIVSGGNYNVLVGDEAGTSITTGDNNVAVGYATMRDNTTGANNTALGFASLIVNTTGQSNTSVGLRSLYANTTASNNTAVGYESLKANTTGSENTAVGQIAMDSNTTGSANVAIGQSSLGGNTTGGYNIAIGVDALNANTTASNNTAVGNVALRANTTGANNVAVGSLALDANTTANDNTAVGQGSMSANTTGAGGTAVGLSSLYSNTTGANNTAVGKSALFANTTGTQNTAVGAFAGDAITTGTLNTVLGGSTGSGITTGAGNTLLGYAAGGVETTGSNNVIVGQAGQAQVAVSDTVAVGDGALQTNTKSSKNTAIGRSALRNLNHTSATDGYNTALGYNAGYSVTTGVQNTLVGGLAGDALTDADNNVAIGTLALSSETNNNGNTAVGSEALKNQNSGGGGDARNTAVGQLAGGAVTTGIQNTLIGALAGDAITTGVENVAVGYESLSTATTAGNNTAVGRMALKFNTSGSNNTAVGHQAAISVTTADDTTAVGKSAASNLTTGSSNTAIGKHALYNASSGANNVAVGALALDANTTASNNTAVGKAALTANTTGPSNVAIGINAGNANTTAANNIYIGNEAGVYSVANTTGGDGIYIGSFAHGTATDSQAPIVIGYNVAGAAGYTTLGNAASDIRAQHGVATWATVSDQRYKKDIVDSTAGLSFINALQPRTFKYKNLGELPETFSAYEADSTEVFKNSNTNHGFIAQEVKAAIDADSSIKDGFKLWDDREDGSQEVAEAALIPVLTKAIQELSAQVDALTARIETLEG